MAFSGALNAWLVDFCEKLGHACSIDFGSHKLATMPPSRTSDNSLMVTEVLGLTPLHQTTLLKSQQHKGSSTLMGLGRGATPWVFFGDWNRHESWVFIIFSQFPCVLAVSNGPLSFYPKICRMYSTKIHDFRWDREPWWAGNVGAAWRGLRKKASYLWYV